MRRFSYSAVLVLVMTVIVYAWYAASRPDVEIGRGQPIRHDDFIFSVVGVQRSMPPVPTGSARVLYLVDIKVVNEAKRVHYHWDDKIAFVVDAQDHRYNPSPLHLTGRSASQTGADLAPGTTQTYRVGFYLPTNAQRPALKFWDGVFMGDALNGVDYRRKRVRLD